MKRYLLDVIVASELSKTRNDPFDDQLNVDDVRQNTVVGLPVTVGFNDDLPVGTVVKSVTFGRQWSIQISVDISKTDKLPIGAAKMHLLAELRRNMRSKQVDCKYSYQERTENMPNATVTPKIESFGFVRQSVHTGSRIVGMRSERMTSR